MIQPVLLSNIDDSIEIKNPCDVVCARYRARELAEAMGFSKKAQWEISIAVSEAATNILKFAEKGIIVIRSVNDGCGYIEFEAIDKGPGFENVEKALMDGVSRGKQINKNMIWNYRLGIGSGLPAINRLMDNLFIASTSGKGAHLIAKKMLENP